MIEGFEALDVAIAVVEELRRPVDQIAKHDPDLAKQIRRAATSIPLNLAEGSGRSGRDRGQHNRIAHGSALEVGAAIRTALAWGYVDAAQVRDVLMVLDRLGAILWRLTH